MNFKFLSLIGLFCASAHAQTTTTSGLPNGEYLIQLNETVSLEIAEAQERIYETAVKLCSGKTPVYGKYKFDSSVPVAGNGDAVQFSFLQRIFCSEELPKTRVSKPEALPESQEAGLVEAVNVATQEFLAAKEAGAFEQAYKLQTQSMQDITALKPWRKRQAEHYGTLGKLLSRDIWRTTLYNNPSGAPKPGLYIAADYESEYSNAPIYCGYVMWYVPSIEVGELKVMREEYGSLGKEALEAVSPAELLQARQSIGCRAQ